MRIISKRIGIITLTTLLLLQCMIGIFVMGNNVLANSYEKEEKSTYFVASFQEQSGDLNFIKKDSEIEFKFVFGNELKDEQGKKVDAWEETITEKDMLKRGDLYYRTQKGYSIYKHNLGSGLKSSVYSKVILKATEDNTDYYLGYAHYRTSTERWEGEDLVTNILSNQILKLNRNVEKTNIKYEGELKKEDKDKVIEKVAKANPSLPVFKKITINGDKLYIDNIGREDSLVFEIDNLITRVKDSEAQTDNSNTKDSETQTKVDVTVKYLFEDGKLYKEEKIKADIGQILDSGDLPGIPIEMRYIDRFLFYTVKGIENETITRIVENQIKDANTQTDNPNTKDSETQTEKPDMKDSSTQTDLTKDDISKMEKDTEKLKDRIDDLKDELKDKDKLNEKQKNEIKKLEDELKKLEEKIKNDREKSEQSKENSEIKKSIEDLSKELKNLQEKLKEVNKVNNLQSTSGSIVPSNTSTGNNKNSSNTGSVGKQETTINKTNEQNNRSSEKENCQMEVRYPNKLTPQKSNNKSEQGNSENTNTNKGVASAPSKARGTVLENKDNANNGYPIHHNDGRDCICNKYSADARQFVTFETKNGKTFHLIINHDEESENVMLLTEVSEDDLLNMVERKEKPKEVVKEEPKKEEAKPVKKDEKNNSGMYILLLLVVGGVLGAGYYFKVVKKKENRELENLEEDDEFFSEENEDAFETDEEIETEEDIDEE